MDLLWTIWSSWGKTTWESHFSPVQVRYRSLVLFLFSELQSFGQKRAGLHACDWLDVVFPGDSFLQKEVGGGPNNGVSEPSETSWLPWKVLGGFEPLLAVIKPRLRVIGVFYLFNVWYCCFCPKFLLFCEGTRFTPKKHQISMQVAESKGLPKLKHHLLPRTKGFWVTVQNLRGTGEVPSVVTFPSTVFRNPTSNSCCALVWFSCCCLWFNAKLPEQRSAHAAWSSHREEIPCWFVC